MRLWMRLARIDTSALTLTGVDVFPFGLANKPVLAEGARRLVLGLKFSKPLACRALPVDTPNA